MILLKQPRETDIRTYGVITTHDAHKYVPFVLTCIDLSPPIYSRV